MTDIIVKDVKNGSEYYYGGGASYTAGNGIDITNNEISADMSTAVYDNTTSGMTATNVQDAIDEVQGSVTEIKNIVEVTTMDSPSATNEGSIVQYKGVTNVNFTHGYFYECVETSTPGTYEWQNINVQDNSGGAIQYNPASPYKPGYLRVGTQAQYNALSQYYTEQEGDTMYFTI